MAFTASEAKARGPCNCYFISAHGAGLCVFCNLVEYSSFILSDLCHRRKNEHNEEFFHGRGC